MSLTGKRRKFIDLYLGSCNFNATASAKQAGYRCTSQHSYEQVGANILRSKEVREAIESYWQMSRMSAEECLIEISKLARGNTRDKVKALAMLSAHHGLLDGSYLSRPNDDIVEQKAELLAQKKIDEMTSELQTEVETFNRKALESNRKKDRAMIEIQKLFAHNPEACRALGLMREVALEYKTIEQVKEELTRDERQHEVEIIPPPRRLNAAPIEKCCKQSNPTKSCHLNHSQRYVGMASKRASA